MGFKAMDQDLARALIARHQDVITPSAQLEAEIYKRTKCPVCGQTGADKVFSAPKIVVDEEGGLEVFNAPFSDSSPLVQGHAKCGQCHTEYSPETGVIIRQDEPVITDPHFNSE